jgi:hypothetical protein
MLTAADVSADDDFVNGVPGMVGTREWKSSPLSIQIRCRSVSKRENSPHG